jgi:hypothetical protein
MEKRQRRGVPAASTATPCGPVAASRRRSNATARVSAAIRARVEAARRIQRERFRDSPELHANAHMTARSWPVPSRIWLEPEIDVAHVSEAIHYRSLDRARLPADGLIRPAAVESPGSSTCISLAAIDGTAELFRYASDQLVQS